MHEKMSTGSTRTSRERITGVILAGGRAARMGGVDKGLVPLQGRPLVAHALQRLRPQVGAVVINANRNYEAYGRFGHPVIVDQEVGYLGPLAGVSAALAAARTAFILTVPCDAPLLPMDLALRLGDAMRPDVDLCFAADPERDQPVYALLRVTLLNDLVDYLREGGRKIDRWYARVQAQRVVFPDIAGFANINRLEDLGAIERLADSA